MKNFITLSAAFILAAGFTVPIQTKTAAYTVQHNNYTLSFSKIIIEDDIDVTLFESSDKSIDVSGTENEITNVEWKVKNGALYLRSKGASLKHKVLVTISVNGLKQLDINGESTVKSLGNISSKSLLVYMNGLGSVSIVNAGKITVINGDGVGLEVKKKTSNVCVLAKET